MSSSSNTGPHWVTSSYSSNHESCVEVAATAGGPTVGLRDTKHLGVGPELWVPTASAAAFVAGVVSDTLTA